MNRYTVLVELNGHTQTTGIEANNADVAQAEADKLSAKLGPLAEHKYIVADSLAPTISHVERFADDMIVATGSVCQWRFVAKVHPDARYIEYVDWTGKYNSDMRKVHNDAVELAVAMAKAERTYHITYGEAPVIEFFDQGLLAGTITESPQAMTARLVSIGQAWVETGVLPEDGERSYRLVIDAAGNNVVQYLSDGDVCGWTTQGHTLAGDHEVTREDLDTMGEMWEANGMDWLATV